MRTSHELCLHERTDMILFLYEPCSTWAHASGQIDGCIGMDG